MNEPKITRWHLERIAFVYLRQSSPHQVKHNQESAKRQRLMKQHALKWGWPDGQIKMLGGDTGKSGTSIHGREDYQTMLTAIMSQEVGIVCARELSRLVRDNEDWNQLVRLCRYQGVLLADEHRVYDPADPQDRVMLGIQGAFNEYELSMICDRMQRSRIQKAERGELYEAFPAGYICRHAPLYEKHPDLRVQRAILKVFADYAQAPSVLQLYRKLCNEGFNLPTVAAGGEWREVCWKPPSYQQLVELLRNPAYAGIYARGKRKTIKTLDESGHASKKRTRVPREQWDVFLEQHHEPYISTETWERNMDKISKNAQLQGAAGTPSPQNGNGLMVGLLRCKRCGHKLHATYRSDGVNYVCRGGSKQREMRGNSCFSFRATYIEKQLCELIIEVAEPAGVAAATKAAEQLAEVQERDRRVILDRLDAAREIEKRAAREYKKTDVTYTSVRQRLGQEWESALVEVQTIGEQLASFDRRQHSVPSPEQQEQLSELGKSLRRVWNHPHSSMVLKKQIVRTLIKEIVADRDEATNEVVLMVHWAGGVHTELRTPTNWRRRRTTILELQAVVRSLRKLLSDEEIACVLNRQKIQNEDHTNWNRLRVVEFRDRHRIPEFNAQEKESAGWMTQAETATCLDISPMSISRLVRNGILPAEQRGVGLPTVIRRTDLSIERVKRAVDQLKNSVNRPLPLNPDQLYLFETNDSSNP